MNSREIAIIAVFTALSVVLVLSPIKFPFIPPFDFLYYQIWEIPLVTAFLVYGPKVGVTISGLNTLILIAFFPGLLPTGPLYNLAAVLSMLLAIYLIHQYLHLKGIQTIHIPYSTALSVAFRVVFMSIINWSIGLRLPPPIGYGLAEDVILYFLPWIGLFNATVALYTIPMGYILAQAVSAGTRTEPWSIIE